MNDQNDVIAVDEDESQGSFTRERFDAIWNERCVLKQFHRSVLSVVTEVGYSEGDIPEFIEGVIYDLDRRVAELEDEVSDLETEGRELRSQTSDP